MRDLPDPFDTFVGDVDISNGMTFYTDGSCVFPNLPEARLAGFSIVVDVCTSDVDRINRALLVKHNDQFPTTLIPVHAGLQIGLQTINRAEFTAALQVVQSCESGCIVTDSQWTVDTFKRVQQDSVAWHYYNDANYDLIVLLCFCFNDMGRKAENFCIKKIRAHQNRTEIESNLDLYGVVANELADKTAKKAVSETVSVMHQLIWEVGRFYQQQRQILRQFLDILVEVDIRRSEAKEHVKNETLPGLLYAQDLKHVSVASTNFEVITDVPTTVLAGFIPGPGLLQTLVNWAALIRWPDTLCEGCLGISHYELAVNFCVATNSCFPRILERGRRYPQFSDPFYHTDAILLPELAFDASRILEQAITILKKYAGIDLFPCAFKERRRFLGIFGNSKTLMGYSLRPQLPSQVAHIDRMLELTSNDSLGNPSCSAKGTSQSDLSRFQHPLDKSEYHDRLKALRRLENGTASGGWSFTSMSLNLFNFFSVHLYPCLQMLAGRQVSLEFRGHDRKPWSCYFPRGLALPDWRLQPSDSASFGIGSLHPADTRQRMT